MTKRKTLWGRPNKIAKKRFKRLKKFANFHKKMDVGAERVFRYALLKSGIKYQRQRIIIVEKNDYIVDFYISWIKLVIEIDEPTHKGREEYDAFRQKQLEGLGYTVLRFTNSDVYTDVNSCVQRVWKLLKLKKLCNLIVKNSYKLLGGDPSLKPIHRKKRHPKKGKKRKNKKNKSISGFSCKGKYTKKKNLKSMNLENLDLSLC